MTKLFLSGAAGFIGSNYLRHLLTTSDCDVVAFDALTYAGNFQSIRDLLGERVHFVHGTITDRALVRSAMENCDQVVHLAAESHVDRSICSADAFVTTNCFGTNVLCDIARQVGIERFVHVSTDEVYGSIEAGSSAETDTLAPRSAYAASKAGSDLIALSYYATHGLPVIVTRASNNYGPYQYPEKIIPLFITNLLDGLGVPLYGDGHNVRDWLHVADHCIAIDTLLVNGRIGEVYNIGGGNEITNLDLTKRLVELCGADTSAINYVVDRPGHDHRYSLDSTKIHSLGWQPSRDFTLGLERTVQWYRRNRSWWASLKQSHKSRT
ncbi:MAG: dTDP-glucose 4,6-dehydratase [Acidimicrobiia bacterium]|nr:dTDP-glucose 4,6-dehydratase [Acidimicrobiia bacterium]